MKIDHLTLLVQSLDASMPYYDALLPMLGYRKLRAYVWTDEAGFYFQFRQASGDARPYERLGAGMNHVGFAAASAEAVAAVRDGMERLGYPVPEIQNLGGVIALFMKDPDGIRFEISWCPPGKSPVD